MCLRCTGNVQQQEIYKYFTDKSTAAHEHIMNSWVLYFVVWLWRILLVFA